MTDLKEGNGKAPENGRSRLTDDFSDEFLGKACANFKRLIDNKEALVNNAQNFVRAMYLPVAEVQAVLAKTKGNYVKVYYGVMDDIDGEHFIFMGPCNEPLKPLATNGSLETANTNLQAAELASDTLQPVTLSMAVPACIGRIPPCPAVNDQFVQE